VKSFKKSPIKLLASPRAVIAQYHNLPYAHRVTNIINRVEALEESEVGICLGEAITAFNHRHRNLEQILTEHFNKVDGRGHSLSHYSHNRKALLGAYLTKEYSFQAAALFNPSIVPHPDQNGLKGGEQKFIMSLRATGEGHISSIIFKTGIADDKGAVSLQESSGLFTPLQRDLSSGNALIKSNTEADINYDLTSSAAIPLDEKVIFPSAPSERMGMEDLRLVKFQHENVSTYYGTYTAYDGTNIRTMLMETSDFNFFRIRSLHGDAINDKGMALFPEKIGGKFAIISRQGSEVLSIMFSADLYTWESFQPLLEPQFPWEFVQLGNCGSPIKTDRGWLLLTHGVGPMRKYVISAILLDLTDPTKIIGRLEEPFIMAGEEEREGYVPNVVYTCGLLRHNNLLVIPYAISDAATLIATVDLEEVLNSMKPYNK
jgi:predicted GH43/DUF377 family glycosyl hydrolase